MVELVEYLAKSLVDKPEEVKVSMTEDAKTCVINLTVAPDDMGKVIGKQGRIAKAIRVVMRAAANRENGRISVEID